MHLQGWGEFDVAMEAGGDDYGGGFLGGGRLSMPAADSWMQAASMTVARPQVRCPAASQQLRLCVISHPTAA
jgi:hypothetical protein